MSFLVDNKYKNRRLIKYGVILGRDIEPEIKIGKIDGISVFQFHSNYWSITYHITPLELIGFEIDDSDQIKISQCDTEKGFSVSFPYYYILGYVNKV
jgi:hypothetical protein